MRGSRYFALVLQLEPLHRCNLSCTGCGRIREYADTLDQMVPLERCLQAAEECDAPMVSVTGGEPLIYPDVERLVQGLLQQGRIVYLCTNGLLMRRKLVDYLTAIYHPGMEPQLTRWVEDGLITPHQAQRIQQKKDVPAVVIRPTKWMYWNVHLDGMEQTHDLVVERKGVFREAFLAIRLAKELGFQVAINTTVYRETDMDEVERLFEFFAALGVDGYTISPGYDYDAAKKDIIQRLGKRPEEFFLTRSLVRQKFAHIEEWGRRFNIFGTPIYQEFLAGKRELTCTAWAIPTFNVRGWKSPCYLMTDAHYPTYQEMLENTDWDRYGVVNGKARDPRCENCMTHCGYDPTGALSPHWRDILKNLSYNFGPKPRPKIRPDVQAEVERYIQESRQRARRSTSPPHPQPTANTTVDAS